MLHACKSLYENNLNISCHYALCCIPLYVYYSCISNTQRKDADVVNHTFGCDQNSKNERVNVFAMSHQSMCIATWKNSWIAIVSSSNGIKYTICKASM